ncbi:mechanosensitive ion channel family protein [Pseudomonas sp. Choline-3u-10]|uniref:mechanosensitive ion channel family protein n=1 Tax=Pseudomonadaceae TaxID=135621 RepID=UPI000617DC22|nr:MULTISPECIES: mechanosensitive ion channel family protein [unclassified Pseudomonas]MAL36398.1 mechanosensitive ion channel family protein [Pseudomonas sp.]MBK3797412.1 mechanosensitive ion channel [Stutzerimonas stutzeri]MBU0947654.1 mechanosensitive ion channel family protein [Gammaproteobacteria bacterium]KJJ62909.1 membrane protein [Pseudomonas sp. 10B238]MBK3876252.1 mechanosensitive ion channel [Stutzerimonas stutzeri]
MSERWLIFSQRWSDQLLLGLQILLILLVAYILQRLVVRGLSRLGSRYPLPPELLLPLRGGIRWFIIGGALIMVLERVGVSATVIWTAFSGFVAVAAVAFFAIWSVLSNLLCAVLIMTVGPFRLGDMVELVESFDKPIVKGRVIDINLLYTTLEESADSGTGAIVQVPNSLFFQKVLRRWRGTEIQSPHHNAHE